MFSAIQRNEPAQSAPRAEPVARRSQTKMAVLKHHLRNLASSLLCRRGCVENVAVATANGQAALNYPQLPPEILSDVISFLDSNSKNHSSLVSKDLKGLVREQQHSLKLKGSELSRALAEFPNITSLKFTEAPTVSDIERILDDQTARQLKHLNLDGCSQLTDAAIVTLVEQCPDLTSLNLIDCIELTDEGIIELANRCQKLTSLNLGGCRQLTDEAFTALAAHCPGLTSMSLGYCSRVTDLAIIELAERCRNLTLLRLDGCAQLTDVAINALANRCPKLTSLDLFSCYQLTEAAITSLAARCSNLTFLDLSGCWRITNFAATALRERYPSLDIRTQWW